MTQTKLFEPLVGACNPLILIPRTVSDQQVNSTPLPQRPLVSPPSVTSPVSLARLKELLAYDPLTGVFTWLQCPGRPDHVGKSAGTRHPKNGILIRISGKLYRAARLAWFYMTGEWPEDLIDHRDGDPTNNRWLNLRPADWALNQQNKRAATSRNLWTNLLGVSFHAASGKFEANIGVTENGRKKKVYLGLFDTDVEAHAAYVQAKRQRHPGNTL